MFFFSIKQKKVKCREKGFSLIELMVSISIIVLITGIVMNKYSSFSSVVILKSQAYELALDIREAQVFGVSIGGGTNNYRGAYGIYVDLANRNSYILFQDDPDSGTKFRYDPDEEIGEPYTIDSRFEITKVCSTANTAEKCGIKAHIAFKRPDFDARMWTDVNTSPREVRIEISSRDNPLVSRSVIVYSSGQISVK